MECQKPKPDCTCFDRNYGEPHKINCPQKQWYIQQAEMAKKTPVSGYIIDRGEVKKIKTSSRGNLIDAENQGFIAYAHESDKWPKIYRSSNEAQEVLDRIFKKCDHKWETISHEERRCAKCHMYNFVMDI